jgi:Polyketide cyclase / dehydrase and lipid transport
MPIPPRRARSFASSWVCETGRVSDPRHVVSVTESIWVARPPEAVWDYTQDFTRRTEWDAGIADASILEQEPRTVRVTEAKRRLEAEPR